MDSSLIAPPIAARLQRERRTIQLMIEIYCRKKHGSAAGWYARPRRLPVAIGHDRAQGLCHECADLLEYALQRIEKCPFKDDKPTCRTCPVHCYKKDMREQVRRMMAYSGPWMMVYHPVLTIQHYLDERNKVTRNKE